MDLAFLLVKKTPLGLTGSAGSGKVLIVPLIRHPVGIRASGWCVRNTKA